VGAARHGREEGAAGRRVRHRGHPPAESPPEGVKGEGAGAPAEGAGESDATAGASPAARQKERKKGRHKEPKRPGRVVDPPHEERSLPNVLAAAAAVPQVGVAPVVGPIAVAPKAPAPRTPRLIGGRQQSPSTGVLGATTRRPPRSGTRLPAAGALAPAALAVAPAANGAGTKPAPAARQKAQSPQSQLVTTVTKIINVIPALVQIAIGALIALALALGVSSRLASLKARRLARQRQQLLEDVGLLQAALLPPVPPRLGPVGTSSAYRPASGPGAGGDFYDMFALGNGQVAVIVGDVSGHGRNSLPQTTLVRFTLRAYLEAGMAPRAALQMAAPVLERQLGDSFATVVLATYHPRERTLTYACAGHPPPLVIGSESIPPVTACSAPPIGAGQPTGTRQTVVSLPGESLVCFYTDGLLDARVDGELFGARRLKLALAGLDGDATASLLLDHIAEQTDQRPDDMAACLLRVEGDRSAPSVKVEEIELDRREAARDRARRLLLARGVAPEEIDRILSSARSAVARDGVVVLELHVGEGAPEVILRRHNVTPFEPEIRASSRAMELSG
jgi:serine phosphatase RsbU (regulator of sigma subunit)